MKTMLRAGVLGAALVAAAAIGYAQGSQDPKTRHPDKTAPTVLTGTSIGFRVEGERGGKPLGRLVVRIDGKWIEVGFAPGVHLLNK